MNFLFADRIREIRSSKIRERLDVPPDVGLISFASSLPAKELFPVKDIEEATKEAFMRWQDTALQYSKSEGILPLREKIANRTNTKFNTKYDYDNICITTGSQQGIDILGKLFINEGDVVLYEPPMQLSVLMAFFNYGVKFV
ncbi:MAG: aminotransferase, partial [Synergistaceae bacterium]|nr:aminotransferase [Synergistaceae bacterium]